MDTGESRLVFWEFWELPMPTMLEAGREARQHCCSGVLSPLGYIAVTGIDSLGNTAVR